MSDLLNERSLLAPFYPGHGIDDDTWYSKVFPNAKKPVWIREGLKEAPGHFEDGLDKKIVERMTADNGRKS